MKKFKGYEEAKTITEQEKLPKGAYILEVMNAEELTYSWGSVLKIDFDIAEGEYAGFFKKNYANQTQEDKKWKGSYRLYVPKDDGSEQDAWTKNLFKTVMTEGFEKSNPTFRWDWDETKLKGLLIGGLFNQKEYDFNGNSGWYTNCKRLVAVDAVRNETYKMPKDEPLEEKTDSKPLPAYGGDGFMKIPDGIEEELPF